jgi:hypothetical protein
MYRRSFLEMETHALMVPEASSGFADLLSGLEGHGITIGPMAGEKTGLLANVRY